MNVWLKSACKKRRVALCFDCIQSAVLTWSEVMAPLGATVNLIYDDPGQATEAVTLLKPIHEPLALGQLLRGHIEQLQLGPLIYHLILRYKGENESIKINCKLCFD